MRPLLVCAGACTALTFLLSNAARAQEAPPPWLSIRPSLGIQEAFTDNVFLTQNNRQDDFVTRGLLGLDASVDDGRTQLTLNSQGTYDQYASNTQLSGASVTGFGTGSYALVPGVLAMEAQGTVANGNVSTFGVSALDRTGVENRTQLSTYAVGPHLTTTIGSVLDLNAAVRFDQVFYTAAASSNVAHLPTDSDIVQVIGRADTGDRLGRLELVTTSEYEKDDHGYHSANGVASVFYRITPELRLITRVGYETVFQPGVTDVNSPVLSGGVELRLNNRSKITLEGGERYNRWTWAANALVQLSDRFYFTGFYTETLQPDQLYIANSFLSYVDAMAALPPPLAPSSFSFNQNLYNQTSLNKEALAHIIYRRDTQSLDFNIDWSDRFFLQNDTHDRTLVSTLTYTRQMRPHVSLFASGNYSHTFASPLFGASETLGFTTHLAYQINTTLDLTVGFGRTHGHQLFKGGETIDENTALIALRKQF